MKAKSLRGPLGVLAVGVIVAALLAGCTAVPAAPAAAPATEAGAGDSAAAGSPVNGKNLTFVLWGFDGYQQGQGKWFQKLAEEQGAKVTLIDGKVDPQVQVKAMDDAVAAGVDGIIFQPVEPAAAVTPILNSQKANIPLVVAGAKPDPSTGAVAPFVQFNDYDVTFQAGKQAAEWLKTNKPDEKAKLAIFDVLTLVYCKDLRMQGFIDGVTSVMGADNVEIVFRDTVEHKRDVAMAKMEDLLQSKPDFNMFTACGADGALGGIAALQAAGRAKAADKVPQTEYIFTIDGTPSELELLLDKNSSVMATMTMTPKENAQQYLNVLEQIMKGELKPNQAIDFKAPGVLLPPDCEGANKILTEQYGLVEGYQPLDCSKFAK